MKKNTIALLIIFGIQASICSAEDKIKTIVIDTQIYSYETETETDKIDENTSLILDVASLLKKKLDASRDYRAVVTTHEEKEERLKKINSENANIMLSIGANFGRKTQRGFEIHVLKSTIHQLLGSQQSREYSDNRSEKHSGIREELIRRVIHIEEESQKLAIILYDELKSFLYTLNDRPLYIADDILVGSGIPSAVVILGNFRNMKDIEILKNPKNQIKIANFMYRAIDKYFKETK